MNLVAVYPSPLSLAQDGIPLEDYVEELLELSHLVSWSDSTLKTCFWSGLDDYPFPPLLAGATTCTLAQYVDYALWLIANYRPAYQPAPPWLLPPLAPPGTIILTAPPASLIQPCSGSLPCSSLHHLLPGSSLHRLLHGPSLY